MADTSKTPPSDHTLIALLAQVAGLYESGGTYRLATGEAYCKKENWLPLTDHNQMALVKAGLRTAGYHYEILWNIENQRHEVALYKLPNAHFDEGAHPDELRALAEAVDAMKRSMAAQAWMALWA